MIAKILIAAAFIAGASAQATAPQWGQCGGQGWSGPTTCPSGWTCKFSNPWYSQCLQGSPDPTTQPPTTQPPTTQPPTTQPPTTEPPTTTQPPTTTPPGSSGPPATTLLPGNYWIRAVAAPNFHKYMQSASRWSAGTAVLGSHTTADQFQLVSGQIVLQLAGNAKLYLNVADPSTSTTHLATSFKTTPNTNGQFSWSGDTLQWTATGINRPNPAAWLACGGGAAPALYINLGPYAYNTPAGCADQTIHYYNGATPDF